MRHSPRPVVFVRAQDRKSVLKSIFLREAVFRKAITAEEVRAGFLPKKAADTV